MVALLQTEDVELLENAAIAIAHFSKECRRLGFVVGVVICSMFY